MRLVEFTPPEPISAEEVCREAVEKNGPTLCVWINGHDEVHVASNLDDLGIVWLLAKAQHRILAE